MVIFNSYVKLPEGNKKLAMSMGLPARSDHRKKAQGEERWGATTTDDNLEEILGSITTR